MHLWHRAPHRETGPVRFRVLLSPPERWCGLPRVGPIPFPVAHPLVGGSGVRRVGLVPGLPGEAFPPWPGIPFAHKGSYWNGLTNAREITRDATHGKPLPFGKRWPVPPKRVSVRRSRFRLGGSRQGSSGPETHPEAGRAGGVGPSGRAGAGRSVLSRAGFGAAAARTGPDSRISGEAGRLLGVPGVPSTARTGGERAVFAL